MVSFAEIIVGYFGGVEPKTFLRGLKRSSSHTTVPTDESHAQTRHPLPLQSRDAELAFRDGIGFGELILSLAAMSPFRCFSAGKAAEAYDRMMSGKARFRLLLTMGL